MGGMETAILAVCCTVVGFGCGAWTFYCGMERRVPLPRVRDVIPERKAKVEIAPQFRIKP